MTADRGALMARPSGQWKKMTALSGVHHIMTAGAKTEWSANELASMLYDHMNIPPTVRELGSWMSRDSRFTNRAGVSGYYSYRLR